MTRHKHAHTGLVTPQLPQLWLTAALRMLAMLVLHVASTLQMICRREAVNATQPTPTDLPKAKTDTQHKETNPAAKHSSPPHSAHPEQRSFAARPSKDERDTHFRSPTHRSSSASCRGSRLDHVRDRLTSPRRANRDSRDKPENDPEV